MSQATMSGLRPCFLNQAASLPQSVVLPVPCRPHNMMTVGGEGARLSRDSVPPSSVTNSSLTILTTCCTGERLSSTSTPTDRSLTRAIKSLTTRKLTSASSSAWRTSRIASLTSASLTRPLPRRRLKTLCNLSLRLSNMGKYPRHTPDKDSIKPDYTPPAVVYRRGEIGRIGNGKGRYLLYGTELTGSIPLRHGFVNAKSALNRDGNRFVAAIPSENTLDFPALPGVH